MSKIVLDDRPPTLAQFATETQLDHFTQKPENQPAPPNRGLDPSTLQAHFAPFQQRASAQQAAFLHAIIDHLTQNGTLKPAHLYESPFTNHHYAGPDGLFEDKELDRLFEILYQINNN
jgi:type I site-specific restriction endonuclease